MKEVFGPGGALERALPEYEPRPEQAALAGAVEHALATGVVPDAVSARWTSASTPLVPGSLDPADEKSLVDPW